MSLWDDFSNLFGAIPPQLVSTGLNVASNVIAGQTAQAGERQNQAINQGNLNAINAEMAEGRAGTAPGTSYLRGVLATPAGTLTPAEQQALQIARKGEQTQLATSGLRGAGQAQLDVMRNLDASNIGGAVQQNIQRQQQAGGELEQANSGMYGKTAFPTTIGASGAGRAAASGAMFPAGALTANASTIGNGMGAMSPLAQVGGGAPATPAANPATAAANPASALALTGVPGSNTAMDQINSTLGAANKGQSQYPGQGDNRSNAVTTGDGSLTFAGS